MVTFSVFQGCCCYFLVKEEYVFDLVVSRGKEACVLGEVGRMGTEGGFVLLVKGGFYKSVGMVF